MSHHSHTMRAYLDSNVWTAYCEKCSAETDADLQQECPGEYRRKMTTLVDTKPEQE